MKIFLSIISVISFAAVLSGCDGIFPTAPRDVLLPDHTRNLGGAMHRETGKKIIFDDCMDCHTDDIKGMSVKVNGVYRWTPSCIQCHGRLWEREGNPDTKRVY